jgi:hypothetical protein
MMNTQADLPSRRLREQSQSDRVTIVACTFTRTSSSFGMGRSTSSSRKPSGGRVPVVNDRLLRRA